MGLSLFWVSTGLWIKCKCVTKAGGEENVIFRKMKRAFSPVFGASFWKVSELK